MQNTIRIFLVALSFLMITAESFAEVPPIPISELKKEAQLIVKGEITAVRCDSHPMDINRCSKDTWYQADLKIDKVIKGKKPKDTIVLIYKKVDFFPRCVGGTEHVHHVGETGTYYLVPRGEEAWRPINWSAVVVKQSGTNDIPQCEKSK